jgi:phenylpropionate dioxygenase-like ring-hydroxylating dioxygenase large terminal subunit
MLSQSDNELLSRTGPGTPMGQLLRRYWIPALLSSEIAERNCEPVRVRLLSENFVAWRDNEGRVGFFDEFCPHRGASLALGRCEGDGLRCIYHGWKFAADGAILETPNAARSTVRDKVRARVFPSVELGGIVWAYLGPKELQPAHPNHAFIAVDAAHRDVTRTVLDVNWAQSMEGHLDSSHAGILHKDSYPYSKRTNPGFTRIFRDETAPFADDDSPVMKVQDTKFGFQVAAIREAELAGQPVKYARVHAFSLPNMCVVPPRLNTFEVPIDDHHVSVIAVFHDPERPIAADATNGVYGPDAMYSFDAAATAGRAVRHFTGTARNGWHQDRGQIRSGQSFSGITGVFAEDFSVLDSMGPIIDRTKEHLAEPDIGIVRMRRLLLKAAADLQNGIEPVMPTPQEERRIQAGDGVLAEGQAWQDLCPGNQPMADAPAAGAVSADAAA